MNKSLTVLGPTSALITAGDTRIQLGTASIAPGDSSAIVDMFPCVEELAGLPAYIRRCKRSPKFKLYTPNPETVETLLQYDGICRGFHNRSPLQIGLATYCQLRQVHTGASAADVCILDRKGLQVYLISTSWARDYDSLSAIIFSWDPKSDYNDSIEKMLDGDMDSAARVEVEERCRQEIHKQAAQDVSDGKEVSASSLPGPLVTRAIWSPFSQVSTEGYHVTFTQHGTPFDASAMGRRQHVANTIFTDDNIGKEYQL